MENGRRASWLSASLIIIIVSILVPFLTFFLPVNSNYGGDKIADKIDSRLKDFELTESGFSYDGRYVWDDGESSYIMVDTSIYQADEDTLTDILNVDGYTNVIIIAKKNVLISSDGNLQSVLWADMYESFESTGSNMVFSKSDIVDIIRTYDTPVIVTAYVILVILALIGFYLSGLFWALVGLIFNSSFKAGLSFGELMKGAIYIRAIWYIIKKLVKTYLLYNVSFLIWALAFIAIFVYMLLSISAYAKNHNNDNNIPPVTEPPLPGMDINENYYNNQNYM
jgi:hypothetical protein